MTREGASPKPPRWRQTGDAAARRVGIVAGEDVAQVGARHQRPAERVHRMTPLAHELADRAVPVDGLRQIRLAAYQERLERRHAEHR